MNNKSPHRLNPRVPPFDPPVRVILLRLGEEYVYPELPGITEPDLTANLSVDESR
jgi:hypothetical protein